MSARNGVSLDLGGWSFQRGHSKGKEDCASFVKQDPFLTPSVEDSLCGRHPSLRDLTTALGRWTLLSPQYKWKKPKRGQMTCSRSQQLAGGQSPRSFLICLTLEPMGWFPVAREHSPPPQATSCPWDALCLAPRRLWGRPGLHKQAQ